MNAPAVVRMPMNLGTARKIAQPPFHFGDPLQIEACEFLELYWAAKRLLWRYSMLYRAEALQHYGKEAFDQLTAAELKDLADWLGQDE